MQDLFTNRSGGLHEALTKRSDCRLPLHLPDELWEGRSGVSMKKRLGELLLERRIIDIDQLNSALVHQRQWGLRLGTALVAKGFVAEGTLVRVLAEALGIPMVDLATVTPDPAALRLVPARVCEQHDVFPLAVLEQKGTRKVLQLATADPLNLTAIDEVAFTCDCVVKPSIAQISSIDHAIRRCYHGESRAIPPLSFEAVVPSANLYPTIGAGGDDATNPARRAPGQTLPMREGFEDYTDDVSEPSGPALAGGRTMSRAPGHALPNVGAHPGSSLPPSAAGELDGTESLEQRFWALMRVLNRRGLLTPDDFASELDDT